MIDINVVLFFVFGVLYLIGYLTGAYFLMIIGGGVIMFAGGSLTLFDQAWMNYVFAMLTGIGAIMHAVITIRNPPKPK
jgi:membrane protein implicated in regulation of membrane protease activity